MVNNLVTPPLPVISPGCRCRGWRKFIRGFFILGWLWNEHNYCAV